jgi:hypothetical protein
MVTSVTKGGTQKLPKKFKIAKTYRHDNFFFFFLLRLGVPQAILLIMATPSCGF